MTANPDIDTSEYEALADAEVTVRVENDLYIADDEKTGVSSQGPSEEAAIENLAAAVETYTESQEDDTGNDWL